MRVHLVCWTMHFHISYSLILLEIYHVFVDFQFIETATSGPCGKVPVLSFVETITATFLHVA